MKTVGSFLVVELMRGGRSPQEACEEAVHRIMERMPTDDLQVGYLALSSERGHWWTRHSRWLQLRPHHCRVLANA